MYCLLFLSRNGIFHRDVKPENILIKVSDNKYYHMMCNTGKDFFAKILWARKSQICLHICVSDQGIHCSLSESVVTVDYTADVQADIDSPV